MRLSRSVPALIFVFGASAFAAVEPLVIAVHGIGGGNRPDGWVDGIAGRWRVPVHEVTFRMEGRTEASSTTDFARNAGQWAQSAQQQIQAIIKGNPGRRVIIVSHSWGTVVTKLALDGGVGGGRTVEPITLAGVPVEEWITLGSPLGRDESAGVAGSLRQLGVDVSKGRPTVVKHWTNFFDPNDPVSRQSHALAGADNVQVQGTALTGIGAHTDIWTNRKVMDTIQSTFERVSVMVPLAQPKSQTATNPTDPENVLYQKLANALVQSNAKDVARRNSDPAYGGKVYRMEYTHPPTAVRKNGLWYISAGWKLMQKSPDQTQYYCTFQRGSDTGPDLISISDAERWVAQAGISWR